MDTTMKNRTLLMKISLLRDQRDDCCFSIKLSKTDLVIVWVGRYFMYHLAIPVPDVCNDLSINKTLSRWAMYTAAAASLRYTI